jgi:phospholipid/cholesterol/gamma-HCH transport system substrate-binding protein
METKASYLAAGLFVIATTIGLILFLLWLSQVDWTKGQKYDIYFSGSVTGLRVNEVVSYNGVPIGKVETIDIDPKKVNMVHVMVEINQPKLIRENSYATLESKGITGALQIRILGSTRDSPTLKAKPEEEHPVIKSQTSSMQAVIEETPRILEKLTRLLEDAKNVFKEENVKAISQTLKNMDKFSAALASQSQEAKVFFHKANQAFDSIIQAGGGVYSAMDQFDKFLVENRPSIHKFTTTGLKSATDLFVNLDSLSKNLDRVIQKLDRDPIHYFFQPEDQGESLPK